MQAVQKSVVQMLVYSKTLPIMNCNTRSIISAVKFTKRYQIKWKYSPLAIDVLPFLGINRDVSVITAKNTTYIYSFERWLLQGL